MTLGSLDELNAGIGEDVVGPNPPIVVRNTPDVGVKIAPVVVDVVIPKGTRPKAAIPPGT